MGRSGAARRRRRVTVVGCYVALIVLALIDWQFVSLRVSVLAIPPLLVIAYYSRISVALSIAVVSASVFTALDRDLIPGGHVFFVNPIVEMVFLAITFCVIVLVAEALRRRSIQNRKLAQHLRDVRTVAARDGLTGVANRNWFLERVRSSVGSNPVSDRKLAIFFCDLDGFKLVNDGYGHAVGDIVLTLAANRLINAIRATDAVARIGGDEFAIVVEPIRDRREARAIAGKIERAFAAPFDIGDARVSIGITLGLGLYPDDGLHVGELLAHADAEMYRSKRRKREPLGRVER
ncbi:MAG: diguanylate cyclase domain-containing protein [Vulcanimicrobiaceae bacterium]